MNDWAGPVNGGHPGSLGASAPPEHGSGLFAPASRGRESGASPVRHHDETDIDARLRWARLSMREWPFSETLTLGSLPTAVSCARGWAKLLLTQWRMSAIAGDAELLVSELVTNAITASLAMGRPNPPPVIVRLYSLPPVVVIEVWDQSPRDLKMAPADAEAEHGRGLMMVEAFSADWGTERFGDESKLVWCRLEAPR
jgi:anti-sigma regulatory factor (Ser/Thr protein kinase)